MRSGSRLGTLASFLLPVAVLVPVLAVPSAASAEDPRNGETVVGTLRQAWTEERHEDLAHAQPTDEVDAQLLSWVEPPRGEAVRVPTEDLPDIEGLASGATVEVTVGGEVADEAAEEGLDEARDLLDVDLLAGAPATAAATPGTTNEVTVVMVRPGGIAAPIGGPVLQDVVDAVNGPVADFWAEQSDGAIQLEVTATRDWLATTATCANPELLFTQVDTLVNWPGAAGQHLLLYVPPSAPGCEDGLATVGTGVGDGGYLYVADVLTSLVAHEFGHNFSLGHAGALQCDGTLEEGNCGLFPYWDLYDVMGLSWEQLGSLNAPHADRLGLLNDPEVVQFHIFASERTVALYGQDEVFVNGGLKLVDPTTDFLTGVDYWLEYRYPRGRDAWLGTAANEPGLESGVLLRIGQDGDDTSLLLDGSPSPEAGWSTDLQAALPVGTPVSVAGGAFIVTVESVSSSAASVRVQPQSPIVAEHDRTGGNAGPLGALLRDDLGCFTDGGCVQEYEHGVIYWSPATGAHALRGAVLDAWVATGSNQGTLGYPISGETCGLTDGGCVQRFEGGQIYWSPATGAHVTRGGIHATWVAAGAESGFLGYPTTDEYCGLRDGGCLQRFEGGRIYWSRATGAWSVRDQTFAPWGQRGYERGVLGYPVGDTVCGLRDGGCLQRFQGGTLYASPGGTGVVKGAIHTRWAASRWEVGPLGYPRGDEVCAARRCIQQFQGGRIAWTSATGARAVVGSIGRHWGSGYTSPQGFPTTEEKCGLVRGGCFQRFERATIYWSSPTGAHTVGLRSRAIANAWAAQGWERGRLGYPTTSERSVPYGFAQSFQGGTLVWDSRTNRVTRR